MPIVACGVTNDARAKVAEAPGAGAIDSTRPTVGETETIAPTDVVVSFERRALLDVHAAFPNLRNVDLTVAQFADQITDRKSVV